MFLWPAILSKVGPLFYCGMLDFYSALGQSLKWTNLILLGCVEAAFLISQQPQSFRGSHASVSTLCHWQARWHPIPWRAAALKTV